MRLIPEKTVEIWTACSILDLLGQGTWIWSPARGEDQDVWHGSLSKFFVLELKAPDHGMHRRITINLRQLRKYVSGFKAKAHPNVMYVLPDPPWNSVPAVGTSPPRAAHPMHRRGFPGWSYVISATGLLTLIGPHPRAKTARIRCEYGHIHPASRPVPIWPFTREMILAVSRAHRALRAGQQLPSADLEHLRNMVRVYRSFAPPPHVLGARSSTLLEFLMQVMACDEPMGTALRTESIGIRTGPIDPDSEPDREQELEDMRLTDDSIKSAIQALNETQPSRRLYIGLP